MRLPTPRNRSADLAGSAHQSSQHTTRHAPIIDDTTQDAKPLALLPYSLAYWVDAVNASCALALLTWGGAA